MFAIITGMPGAIAMLIGGAVGGALPDIDIEGSAVEKLGTKTAGGTGKIARKLGLGNVRLITLLTSTIGAAFDTFVLHPIATIWRFLAQNVFGKVYRKLFQLGGRSGKSLGERLHWLDEAKPWEHRGGLTHSISFMLTSCIMTVPFALLFQSFEFWVGCECGIVSHLIADAMCVSGVKFFFPWAPPIGFKGSKGQPRGKDVRILPGTLQVVTGKDKLTNDELAAMTPDKENEQRRLRFREKLWQKVFQALAIGLVAMIILGVGPASGMSLMPGSDSQDAAQQQQQQQPQQPQSQQGQQQDRQGQGDAEGQSSQDEQPSQQSGVFTAPSGPTDVTGVNPISDDDAAVSETGSVPEHAGPTSLTAGDLDISVLPKGIIKLPDESLHVVGVGPVNEENLENPKWVFTDEEKRMLLAAVGQGRDFQLPSWSQPQDQGGNSDGGNSSGNGSQDGGSGGGSGGSGSGVFGAIVEDTTGIDLDEASNSYTYGFLGITPYTQASGK